ncbi:MAG: DUF1540 domain-containing protein [Epulopiscium sp.]|nr:DUF1540 domain-containing protein [Candidatus Epulonipiscium sp.]
MEKANESIRCSVTSCRHHCTSKDYCSLQTVQIGTHEYCPTEDQCTDCKSFALK